MPTLYQIGGEVSYLCQIIAGNCPPTSIISPIMNFRRVHWIIKRVLRDTEIVIAAFIIETF